MNKYSQQKQDALYIWAYDCPCGYHTELNLKGELQFMVAAHEAACVYTGKVSKKRYEL